MRAYSSAPGKVILFGEHAVVYGITAISAALSDLRIFVSVETLGDEFPRLEVYLHDLKASDAETLDPLLVSYKDLRHLCPMNKPDSPLNVENPKEEDLIPMRISFSHMSPQAAQGVMAVCYLVSRILPKTVLNNEGLKVSVKSAGLPIGAGLGSSAAFSVALAGALLQLRQRLYGDLVKNEDTGGEELNFCTEQVEGPMTVFDFERIHEPEGMLIGWTPPSTLLPVINGWAYASEVVIHGAPSGLDNTTSCYGGALKYDRNSGKFETLAKLPDIQILLTNTKVPRSTKHLVSGVRTLHDSIPAVIKPIFNAIEGISQRFLEILSSITETDQGRKRNKNLIDEIGTLFRINQDLLNAIGVGHPSLDAAREASRLQRFSCKLTGAGGGGCAITLLDDSVDDSKNRKQALEANLHRLGFDTFQSALAGDGVKWHK